MDRSKAIIARTRPARGSRRLEADGGRPVGRSRMGLLRSTDARSVAALGGGGLLRSMDARSMATRGR